MTPYNIGLVGCFSFVSIFSANNLLYCILSLCLCKDFKGEKGYKLQNSFQGKTSKVYLYVHQKICYVKQCLENNSYRQIIFKSILKQSNLKYVTINYFSPTTLQTIPENSFYLQSNCFQKHFKAVRISSNLQRGHSQITLRRLGG